MSEPNSVSIASELLDIKRRNADYAETIDGAIQIISERDRLREALEYIADRAEDAFDFSPKLAELARAALATPADVAKKEANREADPRADRP